MSPGGRAALQRHRPRRLPSENVATGTIVLDDSTELKGDPDRMIRAGVRIFAERVARAVHDGGAISDFPAAR